MNTLGFDIGGANLKAATHQGLTVARPFPLWKQPGDLTAGLRSIAAELNAAPNLVAVTMTGELADCFEFKRDGVEFIVQAVEAAFPKALVRVWMTSGEFAEPDEAVEMPELVSAANWHALATWTARAIPRGTGVLIDVGSTTTDMIPLLDGVPACDGRTDLERLLAGELLYSGATRTPVCAVKPDVTLRGVAAVPLAAELFATMLDVRVLTGELPEDPNETATADGRPVTLAHCRNRLAHMLCCDTSELSPEELNDVARQIADHQDSVIQSAIERVLSRLPQQMNESASGSEQPSLRPAVILSGSGCAVAKTAIDAIGQERFSQVLTLSDMYRHDISTAACAFAVARLASERCLDDLLPLTLL